MGFGCSLCRWARVLRTAKAREKEIPNAPGNSLVVFASSAGQLLEGQHWPAPRESSRVAHWLLGADRSARLAAHRAQAALPRTFEPSSTTSGLVESRQGQGGSISPSAAASVEDERIRVHCIKPIPWSSLAPGDLVLPTRRPQNQSANTGAEREAALRRFKRGVVADKRATSALRLGKSPVTSELV